MKESNLTEEEKAMYAICFSTLIISLFLLVFLGFNSVNTITGAVFHESRNETIIYEEETIKYENISSENITQETALNAILQAEKDMQEMQEEGFGIVWVNDTLIAAKKYIEGENYTALLKEIEKINDTERREKAKELLLTAQEKIGVQVDYKKVLEKTKAINDRKERAYEINDLIRASELRIQEFKQQNLDTSEVEVVFSNAVDEFKNERYEDAEDLLNTIYGKLIELSAETTLVRTIYRAGKENIVVFIKEHYKALLLIIVLLLIIAILIYNRVMIKILRHRIKDMGVEKDVLEDLMKKAQTDYFAKSNITKQTFEIKTSKYKERTA
ncbi:hypothetical protein JYT91_01180, partial [archaeon AH-315-M20]|nr:hypothetical protein [archaeon AH-315-M20]